ncbi:MAG TPA: GNAT family N-acetyltransferase [Roseiflexaceae bacterium]|nr:GNAT family N-acetyltransferase [Roseiflexaceae bacterium]
MTSYVLETDRLILRRFSAGDAAFILELVNDPGWLRFIGDRGVRTLEDARNYIQNGPVEMYDRLGFGLYAVDLKGGGTPIGMCGLLKRATLPAVDLGFAFLPRFAGQGYAAEAAAAVLAYAHQALGLARVLAITSPDNTRSIKLLERIGFQFAGMLQLTEDDQVRLFEYTFG